MYQILRNLLFPLDFPCLNLWNPHFELNDGLWIWNYLDENQPNSVNTTEYFIIFFKIENTDFLTFLTVRCASAALAARAPASYFILNSFRRNKL